MFSNNTLDFGSMDNRRVSDDHKPYKPTIKRHIDSHKEKVHRKMTKKSRKINRKKK